MCHGCLQQICLGNLQPLKHKKAKTVIHAFYERVNESKRKPNTLWADQKKEFYNRIMVR